MNELLAQLRQRKVVRVGLVYCAAMFALLEFSDIAFPRLGIGDAGVDLVLIAGLLGLPVALILAWVFDIGARPPVRAQRIPWATPATLITAAALFLLGVGAGTLFDRDQQGTSARLPKVLVLPFESLSTDQSRQFFADGLSEDISSRLGQFRGIEVIPSSVTVALDRSSPMELGRHLATDYLITGTVRQSDEMVRITSQLIDVQEGRQIWAESFDRRSTVEDLFGIQAEVARRVVASIADPTGVISRVDIDRPTDSLPAYECVLRAYAYMRLHDDASHATARTCLEQAVLLDPDYAEAWGHLGYLYREEYHHNRNAMPGSLERATITLKRAVELDRHHPMVAFSQAMVSFSNGDSVGGLVHAERAVDLNPNNATILATVAIYYAQLGRTAEAVVLADRVVAMHPRPPHWLHMTYATAAYLQGEFMACLKATAAWNQEDDVQWHYHRAAAFAELDRPAEAAEAVSEIRTRFPAFAADPSTEITKYLLVPETAEPFLAGLKRAGLDTSPASGTH